MKYDLGYFDEDSAKLESFEYPFVPEIVKPMSPVRTVTPRSGMDPF